MESNGGVHASVRISGRTLSKPGGESFRLNDRVTIVIFGASGDLSKRKLIPALYHLHEEGYMPERYAVVGFSRTEMTDEAYRAKMVQELQDEAGEIDTGSPLFGSLYYVPGNN